MMEALRAEAVAGERILEAAESVTAEDRERPQSSSDLLHALVRSGLGAEDRVPFSPLGPRAPGPSATALFRALAYPYHPHRRRDALARHYLQRFFVLAQPGGPLPLIEPRPGDILLRIARGEGWATVGVVASPGLHRHHSLMAAGLHGEGHPRIEPGFYVHVVEPGRFARGPRIHLARRVSDDRNIVPGDTMLLRLRPRWPSDWPDDRPGAWSGTWQEAATPVTPAADPGVAPATPTADPGAAQTPQPAAKPVELRVGSGGDAVRQAQQQLNRVHADLVALSLPGLPGGPIPEDGQFTARMEQMVRAFQQQVFGDPSLWDGVIGPATQAELKRRATGAVASETFEPAEAVRTDAAFVRWVQAALNRLTNAGLAEDGRAGPRTYAAIRAFQQAAGLAADGMVGPRTEAALRDALSRLQGGGAAAVKCTGLQASEIVDHFDFNGFNITAAQRPVIDNIAACVAESRRGKDLIGNLRLVGHTDPVGDDAHNDALGLHRAESVRTGLRDALHKLGVADADVTITVETRGKRDLLPGDPALSRRVEVIPPHPYTPAAAAADIAFVLDDDDDKIVDEHARVATFLRFGLWNHAYETTPAVVHELRNGQAEAANFIGSDRRRFYIRGSDPAATTQRITARWKTLKSDRSDDDAPATMDITLTETRAGSHVYVSKAIMLVTDDPDARQDTHSGLTPPLIDAGTRHRGQSNHRLRRATMDGFVFAEYTPASGTAVNVTLPLFQRTPHDERGRVKVNVISYTSAVAGYLKAKPEYIRDQFEHANHRWNQIGLQIDQQPTKEFALPAGLLGPDARYHIELVEPGTGPHEIALLNDLIPRVPNRSVTAVFLPIAGANAFASIYAAEPATAHPLQDRFFVFIHTLLGLDDETLAHELAHIFFNRGDTDTEAQFFTLTNLPPDNFWLPDPRIYRRIQEINNPDPDNDPHNDNVINWVRRVPATRYPAINGFGPATATTGNKLREAF